MRSVYTELKQASGKLVMLRTLFCILMLAIPLALHAQQYSGTITGTVTDATGASVSGASVTVTNPATGSVYNATTSEQGVYVFAQLPVGTYDLLVKQSSFKEYVAKGVEVHTSTTTDVSPKLQVGSASETITVEASDVQVETSSASVGEVVEGQQVRELPLNGENFMGLVTLSPGVSQANSFNSRDKGLLGGSDFSVNGNPYTNNLFLVDGVNNNDVGSNRTILVYPSTDAIAEFKMVRNSYGPEYGQASGAIISITTKSGSNQFHGGFFYAGRNDKLDANDWFTNHDGLPKAELRRNDWGYHVGGPVIKNKLFFFWGQEWDREVRGVAEAACVPSALEQGGDFSSTVDFATPAVAPTVAEPSGSLAKDQCGATQPANWVGPVGTAVYTPTIPTALQAAGNPFKLGAVDPAGALLAQFYPLPNAALSGGNNWFASERQTPQWSEFNGRADYDLTQKHRATFRWTQDTWKAPGPDPNQFWGDSIFPTVSSDWSQPSKSVMAKLTSQLSSSMVNDVEFGYGHNAIITTLSPQSVGLVNQTNTAIPTAWPSALKQPGAYIDGGGAWGGLQPYGSGQTMWTIAPYGNHEDLYAIQDNISKVRGNHLFKAGVYYSTNAKVEFNNGGNDRPAINAGSVTVNTNNQLVNALLPGLNTANDPTGVGQLFKTTENSVNGLAKIGWHDFEWYLGDSWKLNRKLTFNYGFRWSFYREPFALDNHYANFNLADWSATEALANPSDACNGIVIVPGTTPCATQAALLSSLGVSLPLSNGTTGANRSLVSNNNHNIAPRIGFAWDIKGDGKTAVRFGVGQFYQRELVGIDESLARNAPFVIGANDTRTLETPAPLNSPSVSPSAAKDPRAIVPNSWQWNISIERELARNTSLQVGYVGNKGLHLTSMEDLNRVSPANWANAAFLGSGLGGLPNNNPTNIDSYRTANNFGMIGEFARGGDASYHSLQALFRARTGTRSSFQASYTWSHSIGDVELDNSSGSVNQEAFVNPLNTKLDKGNTNINRPNIFVANEVYDLPSFNGSNGFVKGALGGWELNSIINVQSGASFSVFANGATDINHAINPMQIPGAGVCDPTSSTLIANCYQLNSLTGTGYANNQRANGTGIACNSGLSGNTFVNPAAFSVVGYQIGTVGTARRGSCTGAPSRDVDMQLGKNWKFKERYNVKFSMDFFNLFNHANFNSGNIDGNAPQASVSCGANACSPVNNIITSGGQGFTLQANAVHPGRELQYTLRFTF